MRKQSKTTALSAYLVLAARAGDQRALGDLVRLHHPRLTAHAARLLGERDGASDCVQDAWIEIIRGLNGLRDAEAFLPWALRIVTRRVARDITRRQKARAVVAGLLVEADIMPECRANSLPDEDAIAQAILSLPGDQRACVALFYLEEMRVAEVAVALDVPVGTVKTRLMHARKKLRAFLERTI